ncbi:unnamed protein product, partial [Staurois parvus]
FLFSSPTCAAYSCRSLGSAGDSPLAPSDHQGTLTGERSVCKQYRTLPCQHQPAALHCSVVQSNTKQNAYKVKQLIL